MLGETGMPKPEIFKKDMLHMNEKGYALWTDVVMDQVGRHELKFENKGGAK